MLTFWRQKQATLGNQSFLAAKGLLARLGSYSSEQASATDGRVVHHGSGLYHEAACKDCFQHFCGDWHQHWGCWGYQCLKQHGCLSVIIWCICEFCLSSNKEALRAAEYGKPVPRLQGGSAAQLETQQGGDCGKNVTYHCHWISSWQVEGSQHVAHASWS